MPHQGREGASNFTAHRHVLYAGANLAGVLTSMLHVVHSAGIELEGRFRSRYGLQTTMPDGSALTAYSEVRSSYFFESSLAGIAKSQRPDADAHMRSLKPLLQAHLDYLRLIDGIIFVVDSQVERREANLDRLERLVIDLGAVGRRDVEVPLVFQLNKRDCRSALAINVLENELRWPRCEYVPSVAKTGEGVMDALRTLLAMTSNAPTSPVV